MGQSAELPLGLYITSADSNVDLEGFSLSISIDQPVSASPFDGEGATRTLTAKFIAGWDSSYTVVRPLINFETYVCDCGVMVWDTNLPVPQQNLISKEVIDSSTPLGPDIRGEGPLVHGYNRIFDTFEFDHPFERRPNLDQPNEAKVCPTDYTTLVKRCDYTYTGVYMADLAVDPNLLPVTQLTDPAISLDPLIEPDDVIPTSHSIDI